MLGVEVVQIARQHHAERRLDELQRDVVAPGLPGAGRHWAIGTSAGNSLLRVADVLNIADLERLAEERLQPGPRGYFAGGAGDERTLRRNVEAFADWELWPRVLTDVSEVGAGIELLGSELQQPVLVAPVAFQKLANRRGVGSVLTSAPSLAGLLTFSLAFGAVMIQDLGWRVVAC